MATQSGMNRRPLDLVLVAFFILSILYGFVWSLPEGLGVPVTADSPWPPLRGLYEWSVAQEPAHLNPPTSLLANGLYDGFIQSPLLLFVVYGLLRQRHWVRPLSLVYGGAAIANMLIYFAVTFLGPDVPPNPAVYLPFNLPWLIAPAVLVWRMWNPDPFGTGKSGVQMPQPAE